MNKCNFISVAKDLASHLISAGAISLVIYFKYNNISYAMSFIAGALLIDLDHIIDHFLCYGFRGLHLKEFFTRGFLSSGKVYVVFHSWELCIIAAVVSAASGNLSLLFFALGLCVHISIDSFTSKSILFNFLIYRIIKKFSIDELIFGLSGLSE